MNKKGIRIVIALVLMLGLIISTEGVAYAAGDVQAQGKPQPARELFNLHLEGTALHFQLHLVNLNQAVSYKVSVGRSGWTPDIDAAFSPLGKVSRDYTSPEIIRDISNWNYMEGSYEVQVELFNRKGTSLDSTNIATYTFIFTVTFHETNNLSGVSIQVYSDPARTVPKGSALTTDTSGNATINLEDDLVYWYEATKTGYVNLVGDISVNGSALTENFTMATPTAIFAEDFSGVDEYNLPEEWGAYGTNQIYVVNQNSAGGTAPELYIADGQDPGTTYDYWVRTPVIDAYATTTTLNLSFKHYLPIYGFTLQFTYSVEVSNDDGENWTAVLEEIPTYAEYPDYEIGPETVNIDLSAYLGDYILIRWRLQGYTYYLNGWYIDDVIVTGG